MQRGEAILLGLMMVVGLVLGGLLTTTAWLYQSRVAQAERGTELLPTVMAVPAPTRAVTTTVTATTPAPAASLGAVQEKQLFDQNCAACHPNGDKGVGPSLRDSAFKAKFSDDAAIKQVLVNGKGMMPSFRQLSEDQLNGLVAYLRSLN